MPTTQGAASPAAAAGVSRIVSTQDGLSVSDADGGNRRAITPAPGFVGAPYNPRWSHDGTKIAYMAEWQIWVMNADGSGNRMLWRNDGKHPNLPEWSADDRTIYFSDQDMAMYVRVDGSDGGPYRLANGDYAHSAVHLSPDGQRYATSRPVDGAEGTSQVFVGYVDGSAPEYAVTPPDADWGADRWSPDGTTLLGTSTVSIFQSPQIQLIKADASGAQAIGYGYPMAFSPDGSKVLYRPAGDEYRLFTMNVDGTGPAPIPGLVGAGDWVRPGTGVVNVAAGSFHSLAVRADGSVAAWGFNGLGQLGDGTTATRLAAVRVSGLPRTASVSGGLFHSAAVTVDGRVYTWGWNGGGQLGTGTYTDRRTPAVVPGLTNVRAVSAGFAHTLALKDDGTVWAWGWNAAGQVGDGANTDRLTPVQVTGLPKVVAIAAGGAHSLAYAEDGYIWAWGSNAQGQFGNGTTIGSWRPVRATPLAATGIAAGLYHSAAVSSGEVWAWGWNALGQLGNGTTTDSPVPIRAGPLTRVASVAAGAGHTVAVDMDGRAWAWGYNARGQLGTGDLLDSTTPVEVDAPGLLTSAAAGYIHSVGADGRGRALGWGHNDEGEAGIGSTTLAKVPTTTAT